MLAPCERDPGAREDARISGQSSSARCCRGPTEREWWLQDEQWSLRLGRGMARRSRALVVVWVSAYRAPALAGHARDHGGHAQADDKIEDRIFQ